MTSLTEIRFVPNDFNLENTINENKTLKKSNRVLGIILTVVIVTVVGVLIANSVSKRLEEDSKQRF